MSRQVQTNTLAILITSLFALPPSVILQMWSKLVMVRLLPLLSSLVTASEGPSPCTQPVTCFYQPRWAWWPLTLWKVTERSKNIQKLLPCTHTEVTKVFSFLGSAMEALHSIQNFLKGRPKSFKSVDHAIEWRFVFRLQHTLWLKLDNVGQVIYFVDNVLKFQWILSIQDAHHQLLTCLKQDCSQMR